VSFLTEVEAPAGWFDDDLEQLGFVMNASRLWAYQPQWQERIFGPRGVSLGMIPIGPPGSAVGNALSEAAQAANDAGGLQFVIDAEDDRGIFQPSGGNGSVRRLFPSRHDSPGLDIT